MLRTAPAPEVPVEVERKLYTGLLKAYVCAINPNQAELKELGINADKEPVYAGKGSREDAAGKKVEHDNYRLDFWLKNDENDILVKHSIWVSKEDATASKSGNFQVINEKHQTTWVDETHFKAGTAPDSKKGEKWFATPYRRAKEGEAMLREFVNAWTNQTKEKVAVAYKFGDIIKGNLKTLFDIFGTERDTHLLVMLGIRTNPEGKTYQAISRNVFNHWVSPQKVWDQIKEEQGSNNYEIDKYTFIPSDFRLREFTGYGSPSSAPSMKTSEVVKPEYMQGVPEGVPAPAGSESDEDLPF